MAGAWRDAWYLPVELQGTEIDGERLVTLQLSGEIVCGPASRPNNFPGPTYTYIRGTDPLSPGRHEIGYTFEKTGPEPLGAGGIGRITVDGVQVAEGEIARTCTVGYSMDDTFDTGWDKSSPVTGEYGPIARFTGKIIRVDFDSAPDLHPDHDELHADAKVTQAMLRQ